MKPIRPLIVLCAAALVPLGASGQSMEERLRAQLRTTVQQLRDLQEAQAQWQNEKTAVEAARDKAISERDAAKAELARARASQTSERALAQERASHARDRAELEKARTSSAQLVAERRTQGTELAGVQARLDAASGQLQRCEAKNAQLYRVGHELLDAYEHVDLGTFLQTRQPFAQRARVKYDEIAQQYGDALYAGRFDRRMTTTAAPASAPRPASAPEVGP
ncbi:hypothetical protein WKR88_13255 [Trinickia caryophylli]|uniref:DNA repair protein n=1 Tax=Trinickia caryophylli TaxID=28094 RepID=A0A1X7H4V6_TRICW|nr:hypothetical protein [Trinickia caryophylli]PMS09618.1 hypothetical protein C0Z17_24300 [Trinickia caryophylli]TRX17245.1 hypothetical protein FNF07_02685 [Trinickia caryophylli]WQE12020.1 hypothetical protein U0034_00880 [Trinickia caryophylli]SMF79784.1 hypothetical protein SAMN06295900_121102 [Trinickia caryophylli]GLU35587.1 hypothetical protein Busp01_54290 [Trinickia caryophylli]